MFLAFRICARPISSKQEMTFFFGVLPKKFMGSVAGRNAIRTRQSKNYFCVRKRILLCLGFFSKRQDCASTAQEGVGGMRGGFNDRKIADLFPDRL